MQGVSCFFSIFYNLINTANKLFCPAFFKTFWSWIYDSITTNKIKTDVEKYQTSIDSLQTKIDSVSLINKELDNKLAELDTNIAEITQEIELVDNNINVIKKKTNEKVDIVDHYDNTELNQFFS